MAKQGILLVVDDNRNILTSLQYLLGEYFERVITIDSPVTIPTLLNREAVDIVLLDMNFSSGINSGNEGLYWLREIKRLRPQTEVVLFTAYADINLAVTGIKEGASDFVVKPWENARLVQTLQEAYSRIVEARKGKKKAAVAPVASDDGMYWGNSQAIRPLRMLVEKVSTTDANILITGENGTGKDMLAREIHRLSNRKEGPMIAVDMGAITESLFESELFGHVKGSFTDAHTDRIGRFEAADGGTLFLDEIANLPYHLQAKLLTAIQKRCFVKVGSNTQQPTNIRLICATNRNLEDMVRNGEFREDLLYRINTIHLHIPALRERKEDILPLAKRFLEQYARQYGRQVQAFSPEAARRLLEHPWYGNIRELQHTVEKAVILSDSDELRGDMLQLASTASGPEPVAGNAEAEVPFHTLDEMERSMVKRAIDQCEGNLSQAAAMLGITRQTLYNKMKRYGLWWIYSITVRTLLLVGGIVLVTLGIVYGKGGLLVAGLLLCAASIFIFRKMQQQLREKSWLMLEAIRNRDYSFRLPVYGFSGGERVLQDTLNRFGGLMSEQKQLMEQRERFYEQILSSVTSGIIVLDESMKVVQTNPAAARLLGLPVLSTLQQLERYGAEVSHVFRSLGAGERCNIQLSTSKGEVQLLVRASVMQLGERKVRILALNDIRNELDEKELDSWIKLTRVLTHEIMNSIAPISSLSETFLKRKDVVGTPLYDGIRAIHETSVGLISFVDSYRKFSSLQKPSPEPFYLLDLLRQIEGLTLVPDNIILSLQVEPAELMLYADPNLIRQVLINLIKNAVQAIGSEKGRIHVRAYSSADEHVFVYVSNDGPAIPEVEAEQIFVPFFTTRSEGSGIGLSLSRQIMKLSGGSISLLRPGTNGWNTTFVLEFE